MTNLIDNECSEQLKGFSIILVIIGHLALFKFVNLPTWIYTGAYGVAIFLILSGYGLAESYKKNPKMNNFFIKRFKKVLLPYSIVTLLWILIDTKLLHKVYSFNTILLSVLGFDFSRKIDPSMWYITFILIWYIVFFIVFSLPIRNILKVTLLFFTAYIFNQHSDANYTKSIAYQWQLHSYSFPLGITFSLYFNNLISNVHKKIYIIILSILTFALFICYRYSFLNIKRSINYYSTTCIVFSLLFICIFILFGILKVKSNLLSHIGSISYEIYLLEFVFINKYSIFNIFNNKLLSLLIYTAIIYTLSHILRFLNSYLIKWNAKGFNKRLESELLPLN